MQILIPIIILAVCWIAPFPVMLVLALADFMIPDPLPAVDEILMAVIFFNRLKKILFVQEFIRRHKILTCVLFVLIIMGMIAAVSWIVGILGF